MDVEKFRESLRHWWRNPPQFLEADAPALRVIEPAMAQLPALDVATEILGLLVEADANKIGSSEAAIADFDWRERKRESLLSAWVRTAADWPTRAGNSSSEHWQPLLKRLEHWYKSRTVDDHARCQVLAWLASGNQECLQLWTRLLKDDPPRHEAGIREIFAPLFRRSDSVVSVLFPDLLEAISDLGLATAILDLSNFLYREKGMRPHPASSRLQPLSQLLANVTQQLMRVEESPLSAGIAPEQVSRVINDSVGLISALCDFLALHGDKSMVGKLYPCLELRHRRVQVEAAYALATLGEKAGEERLVALAAEPLVRRRALAYCQPLGLLDKVEPEFQTKTAAAESQLVLSLAHPQNLGLAPRSTRLLDQRLLCWPGYESAIECFLFEFEYPFTENPYRNVGIVGPVTHSFSAVLTDLSVEDLYAVFAGWHVSHAEIFAIDSGQFGPQQAGTLGRLQRRLTDQGLEDIVPERLGHFFNEWILVARGRRGDDNGWAIAGPDGPLWLPDEGGFQCLNAELAWYFWVGRTLLRQFNASSHRNESEPNDS